MREGGGYAEKPVRMRERPVRMHETDGICEKPARMREADGIREKPARTHEKPARMRETDGIREKPVRGRQHRPCGTTVLNLTPPREMFRGGQSA
jgi:hypothetical protein